VYVAPLIGYFVAALVYGLHFARRDSRTGQLATAFLGVAVLAHTFVIGMQTSELGHLPLAGTTQAVGMFVWLLSLAYLYTEMTTGERSVGTFIVPLLAALSVIPVVGSGMSDRTPLLDSPWVGVHVSTLLFAYASFAIACVVGITYVLLSKEIKGRQPGFFVARLPSLQVLDTMNHRATTVGWFFLTVGVVSGAFWAAQAVGSGTTDPRLEAMSLQDPKILVALVTWAVYTFQLGARRAAGWGGRRAAWLSAFGFAIVLLNFLPVSYFLTRSHNF
jgi:ABC-type transport system involved in cytochrome c biogenesis permease subunit